MFAPPQPQTGLVEETNQKQKHQPKKPGPGDELIQLILCLKVKPVEKGFFSWLGDILPLLIMADEKIIRQYNKKDNNFGLPARLEITKCPECFDYKHLGTILERVASLETDGRFELLLNSGIMDEILNCPLRYLQGERGFAYHWQMFIDRLPPNI